MTTTTEAKKKSDPLYPIKLHLSWVDLPDDNRYEEVAKYLIQKVAHPSFEIPFDLRNHPVHVSLKDRFKQKGPSLFEAVTLAANAWTGGQGKTPNEDAHQSGIAYVAKRLEAACSQDPKEARRLLRGARRMRVKLDEAIDLQPRLASRDHPGTFGVPEVAANR